MSVTGASGEPWKNVPSSLRPKRAPVAALSGCETSEDVGPTGVRCSGVGGWASAGAPDDAQADPSLQELAASLAQRRQDQLAALPEDVPGRIRGLSDYDFMDPDARDRFETLLDKLRRQVLDAHFAGLSDAIKNVTPESLAANREMVRELNALLQERLAGGDPDPSDFLSRYGSLFPGAETLDDIIDFQRTHP